MFQPPSPIEPGIASRFMLREGIAFLNHGSFGAVPREIFEKQTEWRRRIEAEPVEIIARQNDRLVGEVKQAVGAFLGMEPADFGLVTNATEGVNAYLRSMRLRPGDELLATDHVYNAVRQAMRHVASGAGAEYREFPIATPVKTQEDLIRPIEAALSNRTRLLVIDHVTSPTALIFPVAEIVALCEKRGIDVLIDGAHAPGMLDLNVPALGAAAYAGNLHKWSCCARGAGFLWVRPDRQKPVHPCTVSHFRGEGFAREFDWQGTRDLSAWFTIPDALAYMEKLGWQRIRRHNHQMAIWAQEMIARRWGVTPLAPVDGSLIGSMATLPLPEKLATLTMPEWTLLQQALYTDDQIEAPVMLWKERYYLRVSCQVYNRVEDYERVAEAIERRIG